jgi:hypothetical protein
LPRTRASKPDIDRCAPSSIDRRSALESASSFVSMSPSLKPLSSFAAVSQFLAATAAS